MALYLFIADECFAWPPAPLFRNLAQPFPLPGPMPGGRQFPFPPPLLVDAQGLREATRIPFAGHTLAQGPRRTTKGAVTDTANGIMGLTAPNERLTRVYRSAQLWSRFTEYALGPGQNVLNPTVFHDQSPFWTAGHAFAPPIPAALPRLPENGWVANPNDPPMNIAPQALQADAVLSLVDHYSEHRRRTFPILVNSEPAVQDEFMRQFLVPLGYTLQTRYAITSPHAPSMNLQGNWDTSGIWKGDGTNANTVQATPAQIGAARFPIWTRQVIGDHLTGGRNAPGLPDFLLYAYPHDADAASPHNHPAIAEVKTPWTYTVNHFRDIWDGNNLAVVNNLGNNALLPPHCSFVRQGTTVGHKLLHQLWGELHFFRANLGVWTNGRLVALCIKTNNNTLVFTEYKSWSDPEVPLALAGLSFLAVNQIGRPNLLDRFMLNVQLHF